jgi:ATP-dependent RNA helicase DDX3X
MSGIVNTGEPAAAEPTGNPSSSMTAEEQEAELAKWVERERFDYEAYNAEPGEAKGNTWDLNAQRYEWKEEYGDIGPRVAAIEAALFHNAERANDEILDWGT